MKKLIALLFSFVVCGVLAQELTEFENGQVANADDINANFEALKDAIQAIDTGAVLLSGEGTPSDSIGNLGSYRASC